MQIHQEKFEKLSHCFTNPQYLDKDMDIRTYHFSRSQFGDMDEFINVPMPAPCAPAANLLCGGKNPRFRANRHNWR